MGRFLRGANKEKTAHFGAYLSLNEALVAGIQEVTFEGDERLVLLIRGGGKKHFEIVPPGIWDKLWVIFRRFLIKKEKHARAFDPPRSSHVDTPTGGGGGRAQAQSANPTWAFAHASSAGVRQSCTNWRSRGRVSAPTQVPKDGNDPRGASLARRDSD